MQIDRSIAKGQLVPLVFMQDNLAASQTDVQLEIAQVASAASNVIDEYVMPFAGEIIGISWTLSAAGSAGALGIGPTLAGTEKTALTQAITTAQRGSAIVPRETIPFDANARVGAEITTDGSWNGTSSDLAVVIWVLLYIDGI